MHSTRTFCWPWFSLIAVLFLTSTAPVRALDHTPESTSTEPPTELVFRQPEASPIANFAVALLTEAYAEMGIRLRFVEMPRERSLNEANKGHIAGELGRIPTIDKDFEHLRRVDFPLYEAEMVLVADRRNCGLCSFNDIESFTYIGGTHAAEQVLAEHEVSKPNIKALSFEQAKLLYENGRVEAMLLSSFEAEQLECINNPYTIVVPFKRNTGYHFLHERHAALIPQLERILHRLARSGRVAQLMQEHDAQSLSMQHFMSLPQFGSVTLTAGHWPGYTNLDGSGYYWQLMREIFEPVTDDINFHSNSVNRAYRGFDEERFDALVGTVAVQVSDDTILSRTHINFDRALYLFAKQQDAISDTLAGALERPVCHVAGYQYEQLLPNQLKFYSVSDYLDCFAMLDMGRVGAVVAYEEDAPDWSESPYAKHKLRDGLPIHLAFHRNPRGYRLRDWFDRTFRLLVEERRIDQVYSQEMLQRAYFDTTPPPTSASATGSD
ncbi:hypothetical protein CWI80_10440 [Pseudidiomarina sediminum]|uniref:Solute-binding protein family 3/N-terminal domain-containing protein n=1 Tax=Pseudidiomarina sediminum TaxID=431675 RepID=A0A432Z2W1_9GAMM|nr:hypothetical protein [Pseudidiomarina sediminum]RUO72207.1 hypothetical protein CWI80_10440 [Pseudidiomarina sediminum]